MLKGSKNIAPKILKYIFSLRSDTEYNLHHQSRFTIPQVKIVYNGTDTVSFISPKNMGYSSIRNKEKQSLATFNPLSANPTK